MSRIATILSRLTGREYRNVETSSNQLDSYIDTKISDALALELANYVSQTSLDDQLASYVTKEERGFLNAVLGDASFTNATTLTAIAELQQIFTAPESGDSIYAIDMQVIASGNASGDFKIRISRPEGLGTAELYYASDLDALNAATYTWNTVVNIPTNGLGTQRIASFRGYIRIPSTDDGGTLEFSCAQQTANAQPSVLHRGSYIKFTKLV